jgi:hypothetical protein
VTTNLADPQPAAPPVIGDTSTITSRSRVVSASTWPGTRALTSSPLATRAELNLDEQLGQRQASWSFQLVNGVTGQVLGQLHPVIQPATISHDTMRVIKRDLRIGLTAADVAAINPITDRVLPYMHVAGYAYPLGRYLFNDPTELVSTGGTQGMYSLLDEMFIIDQQMETGFASSSTVDLAVRALLDGLPLQLVLIEATQYAAVGGWAAGTTRGQVLAALAIQGDYETPWMDNNGDFRMVQTVDPDKVPAALDLDTGRRVLRSSISQTNDLLNAPNRFVIIGNSGTSVDTPIVGVYDVPTNAPHSIANRGFVIPRVENLQVANSVQATAIARGWGIRQTVFERADLDTVPDPRHDAYQVIHWSGRNWLELAWSMTCAEGATMRHSLRRALVA